MKVKRQKNEINAGSMADIAFLLLVFFLVVTQINTDKGILVSLPPYEIDPPTDRVPPKNLLSVKLNQFDELMVRGEPTEIKDLKLKTIDFIMNPDKKKNMPTKPTNAVVSLQNDRATSYKAYLQVYNELKSAYSTLWENAAIDKFGKSYESLNKVDKKSIRNTIPLVISEAEPSNFVATD